MKEDEEEKDEEGRAIKANISKCDNIKTNPKKKKKKQKRERLQQDSQQSNSKKIFTSDYKVLISLVNKKLPHAVHLTYYYLQIMGKAVSTLKKQQIISNY